MNRAVEAVKQGHRTISTIGVECGWDVATIDLRQALAAGAVEYDTAGYLQARAGGCV